MIEITLVHIFTHFSFIELTIFSYYIITWHTYLHTLIDDYNPTAERWTIKEVIKSFKTKTKTTLLINTAFCLTQIVSYQQHQNNEWLRKNIFRKKGWNDDNSKSIHHHLIVETAITFLISISFLFAHFLFTTIAAHICRRQSCYKTPNTHKALFMWMTWPCWLFPLQSLHKHSERILFLFILEAIQQLT